MKPNRQQRRVALEAAQQQAEDAAAARQRLIEMGKTGQPTPPVQAACCEGRPAGHQGKCWPLGATHPAS